MTDNDYEPTKRELADPPRAALLRLAELQRDFCYLREHVERIDKVVFGDGQVGIKIRVERLEQSRKIRAWLEKTVIAALIVLVTGLLLSVVSSRFTGKMPVPHGPVPHKPTPPTSGLKPPVSSLQPRESRP